MKAAVEPVAMIEAPACRCGSAAWTALMMPIPLVSNTSAQACSGCSLFWPMTPALATTMSSLPSSAIPRSIAATQLRPLAHVGLHRDHPAVQRLDQAGGLLQVVRAGQVVGQAVDVVADVDGDDVRALLRQPHRVAAALTAGGPGDEGNFALDASHSLCPFARHAR